MVRDDRCHHIVCYRRCYNQKVLAPAIRCPSEIVTSVGSNPSHLEEVELITGAAYANVFPNLWLAVTEGDVGGRLDRLPDWPSTEILEDGQIVPLEAVEGVWRDCYTGGRVDVLSDGVRMYNAHNRNDTIFGEEFNCMLAAPFWSVIDWRGSWDEMSCQS